MNSSYEIARAIRGPILLVIIGSLFAADQIGGIGFDRTWPVILIAIGLLKLLERMLAPPPPSPAPPLAGGPVQ
ncbi:MAG: DUF5668 domain-containing protein [Bryobacteraceae bacterium]